MSVLRAMLVLGVLEAFGPLSMDVYMPQLPHLARGFDVPDSLAQATMSACMIGLGLGQLIAGPLSDRFGRRRPLVIGVAAFAVLSGACAVAPSIQILLVARFLQGVAGSAGLVISMAVARDMFSGVELSRMLSMLALVSGSAPVVAPLIGGQLALFMDWRGVFWVLTGVGVALVALVLFGLPETLAAGVRHSGGFVELRRHMAAVLRDRLFVAVLVVGATSGIGFFAYLSMSSFVLEQEFGLTPQQFSFVFAANAVANIVGGQLSRLIVARMTPQRVYLLGALATATATVALFVWALVGAGLGAIVVALVLFMFCVGLSGPNGTTLALTHHGSRAGTAAAVMGMSSFVVGPIVAPLISSWGTTAVVMAATMAAASIVGATVAWFAVRPAARGVAADATPASPAEA
ncbi:Bcr/CflA family efflux MFS transporter [Microbacterium protaetiae]|uniref:Bcr/CflA family efflux MFS transporter n=2 Tax=Microbacterium protaetiae TaxID=2509458 RepID=A0A4P6EI56_9MICO|nr:Bcr/CflA family efflux MFS transporter [Microbacterium protaetiae]